MTLASLKHPAGDSDVQCIHLCIFCISSHMLFPLSSPSVKTSAPQEAPPSSPCPSPSNPRAPPRDPTPLTPGAPVSSSSSSRSSTTTSERPKTDAGPSGSTQSPLPEGPRTYSRTHKKVYSTFFVAVGGSVFDCVCPWREYSNMVIMKYFVCIHLVDGGPVIHLR